MRSSIYYWVVTLVTNLKCGSNSSVPHDVPSLGLKNPHRTKLEEKIRIRVSVERHDRTELVEMHPCLYYRRNNLVDDYNRLQNSCFDV